jgi:hypothetical protein
MKWHLKDGEGSDHDLFQSINLSLRSSGEDLDKPQLV